MKIKKSNLKYLIEQLLFEGKKVGLLSLIEEIGGSYYFFKGGVGLGESLWGIKQGDKTSKFIEDLNVYFA